jgi:hypothetical protein
MDVLPGEPGRDEWIEELRQPEGIAQHGRDNNAFRA